MAIKKVERYETSDGEVFATKAEAESHEAKLEFEKWYEDNKLFGIYAGSYVEFDDLMDWLEENSSIIKKFL